MKKIIREYPVVFVFLPGFFLGLCASIGHTIKEQYYTMGENVIVFGTIISFLLLIIIPILGSDKDEERLEIFIGIIGFGILVSFWLGLFLGLIPANIIVSML